MTWWRVPYALRGARFTQCHLGRLSSTTSTTLTFTLLQFIEAIHVYQADIINCFNMSSHERQNNRRNSSLKLKDRWISAFQNESFVGSGNKDEHIAFCPEKVGEPKEEERPKVGKEEEGANWEEEPNVEETSKKTDLQNEGGNIACPKTDSEDADFRGRVPSVSELHSQLEELMMALISLQISRCAIFHLFLNITIREAHSTKT